MSRSNVQCGARRGRSGPAGPRVPTSSPLDRESIAHQRNLDVLLFDAGQLDAERHLLVCSGDVNAGSQYSAHTAAKPVLEVGIKPVLKARKGSIWR